MAGMPSRHDPSGPQALQPEAPAGTRPAESGAPDGTALDLNATSAGLEAGLLMVFGPEGDPLPPAAFCAAASVQPDAIVRLGEDAGVPAHRVAAVLEAQAVGRLAGAQDEAAAWVEAMLHPKGLPAMAAVADLQAEDGACDVIVYGREVVVAIPGGPSFVIATARAGQPAELRGRLTSRDGAPVPLRDLTAGLREEAARSGGDGTGLLTEIVVPGCTLARQNDVLVLATTSGTRFCICPAAGASVDETIVNLSRADGEPLAVEPLVGAVRASGPPARGGGRSPRSPP